MLLNKVPSIDCLRFFFKMFVRKQNDNGKQIIIFVYV